MIKKKCATYVQKKHFPKNRVQFKVMAEFAILIKGQLAMADGQSLHLGINC